MRTIQTNWIVEDTTFVAKHGKQNLVNQLTLLLVACCSIHGLGDARATMFAVVHCLLAAIAACYITRISVIRLA
jgi:hypothetical protein